MPRVRSACWQVSRQSRQKTFRSSLGQTVLTYGTALADVNVVCFPHDALSVKCTDVTEFDHALSTLVSDMTSAMYSSGGIGLAAPQVNVTKNVIIIDASNGEDARSLLVLVNPKLIAQSVETATEEEGCLSLPGIRLAIERPLNVTVEYNNTLGMRTSMTFGGLEARIVQHELDHLVGTTLLDKVGSMTRRLAMKELRT